MSFLPEGRHGERTPAFSISLVLKFYDGASEYALSASTGAVTATRNYSVNGELVATRLGRALKIIASDRHATPIVEIDGDTLGVTKRRLAPFGDPLTTSTWTSTRGFVNKTTDTSVGTAHLDAREYDPTLGRFLSVDPIGDPNNPQQLNGYAYANNSPVTTSDPTGLFIPCEGASCGSAPPGSPYRPGKGAKEERPVRSGPIRSVRPAPSPSRPIPAPAGPSGPRPDATMLTGSSFNPLSEWWSAIKSASKVAFDPGECSAFSWGCGLEIVMIVPFLKIGKAAKAPGIIGDSKKAAKTKSPRVRDERGSIGPFNKTAPLTNAQAVDMAGRVGYEPTKFIMRGQKVFANGKNYIVQDTTSHSGGLWKMARTVDGLNSKKTRIGTYDYNLERIGP